MQSVYQVDPGSTASNWNTDLTEEHFVRELFRCVDVALTRIEQSWSSYRALHACIAVITYVVLVTPKHLSSEPWRLLIRCREIAVAWSDAVEELIEFQYSRNEDLINQHWYINGLIVLTFGTYTGERQPTPDDLEDSIHTLLRARVVMFEREVSTKDFEMQRLHIHCYRIIVRWEDRVKMILNDSSECLSRIVRRHFKVISISWQTVALTSYYEGKCFMHDGSVSVGHIHIVEV